MDSQSHSKCSSFANFIQNVKFYGLGSIPTLAWFAWSLGNFIYPNLPQYPQLQTSTNIVGKVPAMD